MIIKSGCESNITPRSLAEVKGVNVMPRNDTVGLVSCLPMRCLVPRSIKFFLSGLINRWFSQHQVVTLSKSSSSFLNELLVLASGNDRNGLESSTYNSRQHSCGALGRSFNQMQKRKGDKMVPWGTPWVIVSASDSVDPIRTSWGRPDK